MSPDSPVPRVVLLGRLSLYGAGAARLHDEVVPITARWLDPAIRKGATAAGRAKPPVVAHVPVVVSDDAAAVLAGGTRQFGFYPRLPFYSAMWQDAGFPEAEKGEFSERMANALVISGDAETVATRIRDIPNSGADEIIASIVNLDDGGESAKRTLNLLGELARGA